MTPKPDSIWPYAAAVPAIDKFVDQSHYLYEVGPGLGDDPMAADVDGEFAAYFEGTERRLRFMASPPIGDLAAQFDGHNCTGVHPQSIEVLTLQLALGFEGTDSEFKRLVNRTERDSFRVSSTRVRNGDLFSGEDYCLTVIPLRVAQKVAIGLGGPQAACVAFHLVEVMCTCFEVEILNAAHLQILGNPFCPILQPCLQEPSSRAVHRFLRTDTDYANWWLKRRKRLGPVLSRQPADVDVKLPLSVALKLLRSEPNARGRRSRRYIGEPPWLDVWPGAGGCREYWYSVLGNIAAGDLFRAAAARKRFAFG